MPQVILLTVKSCEFDAGSNMTNPMGFMIRVVADQAGSVTNLRMYFYMPNADTPKLLGWRALHDGALVLMLQRRDFAKYILMLDQVKAVYIRVVLEGPNDDIIAFDLSTTHFPPEDRQRKVEESDAAELKKLTTKP